MTDIEQKLMDLENRVRWLELNQGLPKYPETYMVSPECYKQTPSTQACMPEEYKGVNYGK